MPRFVLLFHELPRASSRATHCDLMLEDSEVLRTWALEQLPAAWSTLAAVAPLAISAGELVELTPLADHRLAYLEYEGPVSGERGLVQRVAKGDYHGLEKEGGAVYCLAGRSSQGDVLRGSIEQVATATSQPRWILRAEPA